MTTSYKRTSIYLTEEQHQRLREAAFRQRVSMATLMRNALLNLLEEQEDAEEGLKVIDEYRKEGGMNWEDYKRAREASGL